MDKSRWLIIGVAVLAAAAASDETLYKIEPGPYDVRIVDELTLNDAVQGRDVTLRVLYPGTMNSPAKTSVVRSWS